ncbi:MAG TPA: tRNA (adenosine(37)-N6)-threonylcarbamoyltransferase complex ATPase subunit type 1 TsaE [Candidatus Paceibacterota bacterium]|nr:tRNA (adenosine(37)-N6)-threonylcarbamoyltransferase complex ATPase subunit type 1 TsaE [Candidatus Paceibacterota bacterium]
MAVHRTYSAKETKALGEKFAVSATRSAPRAREKNAFVFALSGELGAGKTAFAQGFLRGLGVKKKSASPTFIIFRKFAVRNSRFANAYHVDAYRIKKPGELSALGFKEIFFDPTNIVLIEWAEKFGSTLPKNAIWLRFRHGKKENERIIRSD